MTTVMFLESCEHCTVQECTYVEIAPDQVSQAPALMQECYQRHVAKLRDAKRPWHKKIHNGTGKMCSIPTPWKRENPEK
jgi:hypothetical protein